MEEQFILRVPPSVAERIEQLLSENTSSSDDKSIDLSFSDGRSGSFSLGNDRFPAYLLDLPTVVESYKTYDDSVLIKTADIGQMIMVKEKEKEDTIPDEVEYRHGLTPPMRDARRRRFRREPDLNPVLVRRVEKDLQNILAGGTAENNDGDVVMENGEENVRRSHKKVEPKLSSGKKPSVPETGTSTGGGGGGVEAERSDSDESDDSA